LPLNVVDSSGWLAYFVNTSTASRFAEPIEDVGNLIVPSISIYEVFKRSAIVQGSDMARRGVGQMSLGSVIDLDTKLALDAALIAIEHRLPMSDSIIYATAQRYGADLWTQDADFDGLPGVRYFPRVSGG
jgi:toxin FitB